MEEEISLRELIEVPLRYWRYIVLLSLGAALIAFVASSLMPVRYRAEAHLIIRMTKADVKTVGQPLKSLALSGVVARAVLQRMEGRLEPAMRSTGSLRSMVSVEVKGQALLVRVTAPDPQLAAELANVWAEETEHHINASYIELAAKPSEELESQLQEAKARYETAQEALETFLADNHIGELEREIERRKALIAAYQQAQTDSEVQVYSRQLSTRRQLLADRYAEMVTVEGLLRKARSLQEQLERGTASEAGRWGEALSLILLEARALGGTSGGNLQLMVGEKAPEVKAEDVATLIAVLEARRDKLQEEIKHLSSEVLKAQAYDIERPKDDPLSSQIELYTRELLNLEAQLEAERARKNELTQARDVAWKQYWALVQMTSTVEKPWIQTYLAATAIPPTAPVSPRKMLNTATAGILGFLLGVLGAFFRDYWIASEAPPPRKPGQG